MMRAPVGSAYPQPPAVAPQLDRSKAIVYVGGALIMANFITQNPNLLIDIFAPEANGIAGFDNYVDVVLQAAGIGILYFVSRISDLGGTAALLFLAALWLVFIWRHAAGLEKFVNSAPTSKSGGASSSGGSSK